MTHELQKRSGEASVGRNGAVSARFGVRGSFLVDALLFGVGLALAYLGLEFSLEHAGLYDFNMHWTSGLIERNGTYTDLSRLQATMDSLGMQRVREGVYGTPSLVALVYVPLSLLPYLWAVTVWHLLCGLLVTIGVRTAVGNRSWPLWVPVLLFGIGMQNAVSLGNFGVMTVAILLYVYGTLRNGQEVRGGVAFGVIAALKLFPGFAVFALLFTRSWKTLLWAASVGALVTVAAVPVLSPSDAVPAFRMTLGLGGFIHEDGSNIGIPGQVLHFTGSQSLAQISSWLGLLVAVAVLWIRRRSAPHLLFALATLLMITVQSISWVLYLPIATVGLIATVQLGGLWSRVLGASLYALSAWTLLAWATELPTRSAFLASTAALVGSVVLLFALMRRGESGKLYIQGAPADQEPSPE